LAKTLESLEQTIKEPVRGMRSHCLIWYILQPWLPSH